MPLTIYLHTGGPKAGSTTIQMFLRNNKKALKKEGFFVPRFLGAFSHTKLAIYGRNDGDLPARLDGIVPESTEELDRFRATIERQTQKYFVSDRNYVISTETLGTLLDPPAAARTVSLLKSTGHEVRVIQYFRDPYDYLAAVYSNSLRRGTAKKSMMPERQSLEKRYYYLDICEQWASEIGRENVDAQILLKDRLKNGDLIDDFLFKIGIDSEKAGHFKRVSEPLNSSVDYLVAGFLLDIRRSRVASPKKEVRNALRQLSPAVSRREGVLVPATVRDFMRSELKENLSEWNRTYLGGRKAWPFPPYREDNKKEIRAPDKKEFYEILFDLLEQKHFNPTVKHLRRYRTIED